MRIAILTTGGTIEKSFIESDGSLRNVGSVLETILNELRLIDLDIRHVKVMSKDSLDMTPEDRDVILAAVREALPASDAVIVVHGTDTLAVTGEHLHAHLNEVAGDRLMKPVVLTGAMRPYEFRDSDAFQNMTEALLACRLLPGGVYVVMHNQALRFPGARKDRERGTFTGPPAPQAAR